MYTINLSVLIFSELPILIFKLLYLFNIYLCVFLINKIPIKYDVLCMNV